MALTLLLGKGVAICVFSWVWGGNFAGELGVLSPFSFPSPKFIILFLTSII